MNYILTYTVVCATKHYATAKECYDGQFLSIKLGCYNEREGILFIMESSIIIFTSERLLTLFMCFRLFVVLIRGCLFIVFTKEIWFMFLKFTRTVYKS